MYDKLTRHLTLLVFASDPHLDCVASREDSEDYGDDYVVGEFQHARNPKGTDPLDRRVVWLRMLVSVCLVGCLS